MLPPDVAGPRSICFLSEKKGVKIDNGVWNSGGTYKGVARYTCKDVDCPGKKYVWTCNGRCEVNETKDERCCKLHPNYKYVKYEGQHTCSYYQCSGSFKRKLLDRENSSVTSLTPEEKATQMFGMPCAVVSSLPEGVTGEKVFVIKCKDNHPGKNLQKYVNDSRSYKKSSTTCKNLVKLFENNNQIQVFNYSCEGSYVCNNIGCQYNRRFIVTNQISIRSAEQNEFLCTTCSFPLDKLNCSAKKTVAFQSLDEAEGETENYIYVVHSGDHSCLAKFKIQEETKQAIETYFKENPNMVPSMAWYNMLSKKIREGGSKEEVQQLVLAQVKHWVLSNIKTSVKCSIMPHPTLIDAALNVKKTYVDGPAVSSYNILLDVVSESRYCRCCNKVFDFDPTNCDCGSPDLIDTGMFIFLSSKASFETMKEMGEGNTLYGQSCHIDHQAGRTKEFTTFEGVTYDPDLKNIATVFTFHMQGENEFHVAAAFSWLNKRYAEMFGSSTFFSPIGFVSDEGGGLLAGLRAIYPSKPITTDNFHFKQNVYQLVSREIGSNKDIIRYLRFCIALQDTVSPYIYQKVLAAFKSWASQKTERKERVVPFIDWWDQRKSHWSKAYKNNDLEGHSLAESGNSKMGRTDIMKNKPLYDCLQYEVCAYMRHHTKLQSLQNGFYKGGRRGPSRPVLQHRAADGLHQRIKSSPKSLEECKTYVTEIFSLIGIPSEDIMDCDDNDFSEYDHAEFLKKEVFEKEVESRIKPTSSHNYKDKVAVSIHDTNTITRKPGRPKNSKKRKVCAGDKLSDESDGEGENNNPLLKHGQYKVLPSQWKWMADKVRAMFATYAVAYVSNGSYTVSKCDKSSPPRDVRIANSTNCSCEDFARKQNQMTTKPLTLNCKHIVFVLISLGVNENDVPLRHHHLSDDQLNIINGLEVHWVSANSTNNVWNAKTGISDGIEDTKTYKDLFSAQKHLKNIKCEWRAMHYMKTTRALER